MNDKRSVVSVPPETDQLVLLMYKKMGILEKRPPK